MWSEATREEATKAKKWKVLLVEHGKHSLTTQDGELSGLSQPTVSSALLQMNKSYCDSPEHLVWN